MNFRICSPGCSSLLTSSPRAESPLRAETLLASLFGVKSCHRYNPVTVVARAGEMGPGRAEGPPQPPGPRPPSCRRPAGATGPGGASPFDEASRPGTAWVAPEQAGTLGLSGRGHGPLTGNAGRRARGGRAPLRRGRVRSFPSPAPPRSTAIPQCSGAPPAGSAMRGPLPFIQMSHRGRRRGARREL